MTNQEKELFKNLMTSLKLIASAVSNDSCLSPSEVREAIGDELENISDYLPSNAFTKDFLNVVKGNLEDKEASDVLYFIKTNSQGRFIIAELTHITINRVINIISDYDSNIFIVTNGNEVVFSKDGFPRF